MPGELLLDGSRREAKADRAAADFRKSSMAGLTGRRSGLSRSRESMRAAHRPDRRRLPMQRVRGDVRPGVLPSAHSGASGA
jgi:hypothetical protein